MRKSSKTMMSMTDDQIHFHLEGIDNYVEASNAATGARVDSNANIEMKTIASLQGEQFKSEAIQINRTLVQESLVEVFGKDQGRRLAKQYLRDLEDHLIYCHDETSLNPYCAAISLFPMLERGTRCLGGKSEAPKHLQAYVGQLLNTIFMISSQVAGACGVPGALIHFDSYARNDYGDNYLETHKAEIKASLETFLYTINEPAGSRNNQSCFSNISIFDKAYFEALYGNMFYPAIPDIKPNWESYKKLQEYTLDLIREENTKQILTFPVKTATVLHDGETPKDPEFVDMIADDLSKGSLMFIYLSESVDSLSSCCFGKDQMCLTKSSNGVNFMSFGELDSRKYNEVKKNFTVFHNGSWVRGKSVKVPINDKKMYSVTLANNKTLTVTEDHLHPTLVGDKRTSHLSVDDYLLFNSLPLDTFPEQDLGLTYEQGFTVGAFIGDGSYGTRFPQKGGSVKIYDTHFSLNKDCYDLISSTVTVANHQLGGSGDVKLSSVYNNVYPARISSLLLSEFIQKWVSGCSAHTKELNLDVLLQSKEFRQGILDGWYETDGGNSNRCYTTSEKLVPQMECLITSLGGHSIVDVSDRTHEKVVIRGAEYSRNYPLYCVRWYSPGNKRSMGDVFKIHNNSTFFKIKSIEVLDTYDSDSVYCFEMVDKSEPYFTLPNGVITHNCRLKNSLKDDEGEISEFSYSLGAGGVSTGSLNVITLNINRITQEKKNLKSIVDRVHKYQVAHRNITERFKDNGLLPLYDAGFVDISRQYLTIGVNGIVEAGQALGMPIKPGGEYEDFANKILGIISEANKEARLTYKLKFNTEFVPAEGLGVRNAKWDREDGLRVPRDCYNSYMFPVEDPKLSVVDKFKLHGKDLGRHCDGGQALHLNLDENPTKEGYKALINLAIKTGCEYFTTNVLRTCCEACGHIEFSKTGACVKCESEDISYATRIIGYLKKIPNFSEPRQEEASLRHYHETVSDLEE